MASFYQTIPSVDEEHLHEEIERFDDFTIASAWERFIAEIEAICRQWLASNLKSLMEKGAIQTEISPKLYKVKCDLKYVSKSYIMEYYFVHNCIDTVENWNSSLHDLQLCFGVKDFLVIAPQSASRVVLDSPEATKLLSAVAIALTNSCSMWPAFVPVHDPSRKAYIGIQNMQTVYTRRFESDLISSQVPVKYMHLEGLYDLFVSKFAYTSSEMAMYVPQVHFTMKSTYKTILSGEDYDDLTSDAENGESGESLSNGILNKTQWDDNCPWSEWYSAEDPVKGFNLIATWLEKIVENALDMAVLENSSPNEAEIWSVIPILSANFLEGGRTGFASQLQLLIDTLAMSFEAQYMEDFVSIETPTPENIKSSMVIPSPTVLDRVLKDIFEREPMVVDSFTSDDKNSKAIKSAPFGSLFARFCLHCLWIGNCNIRAIAILWIEFIREVRWCWEESQQLPKISTNCPVDLTTCLINQKLQMIAICIERKREMNEEFQDCIGSSEDFHSKDNVHQYGTEIARADNSEVARSDEVPISRTSDSMRRGSNGEIGSMMLLKSYERMHAPCTQDMPLMTEDMHEERFQAAETSGDSFSFSGQIERDILLSDMSAFKAANPDAVFEDFIRWHSPKDWETDETVENVHPGNSGMNGRENDWPPCGRLSQRMSEHGNLWRKLWNEAPALSAFEQKPLLDPIREGEKVLHYLETIRPSDLLEQMVCTAFRSSADTLCQTSFGDLKRMKLKLEQLYLTMASTLKILQGRGGSVDNESMEDLRRLCVVFEHVEKLLAVAASLYLKFHQAPRLSEEFFSDFYKSYLPRMGNGSVDAHQVVFDKPRQVSMQERQSIRSMFAPPSASQSWRKVLSMGNLLNGHEPFIRELKFSVFDTFSNNYHFAKTQHSATETYRMYVRGTSNDLRVALSVASCD